MIKHGFYSVVFSSFLFCPFYFLSIFSTEPMEEISSEELKTGSNMAPKSLRPCAGDAYLLFQVQ